MSGVFAPDLLAGKVAFVMGGTRGMNLAIATAYAAHGARVAVLSRNPDRCGQAAEGIREATGGDAIGIPVDAREYEDVAAAVDKAVATFGKLDLVVAGQAGNFYAPVTGMSAKGFRTVVDIDLTGTCEHHFVTIDGSAKVAYIPKDKVIGLSKINRLVRFFAQRPQVQERLTQQILVAMQTLLGTEDVAVTISAVHYCVKARGVKDGNSSTRTTSLGGVFKSDPSSRAEFLS